MHEVNHFIFFDAVGTSNDFMRCRIPLIKWSKSFICNKKPDFFEEEKWRNEYFIERKK